VEHAEYQRLRERIFAAFWDELAALVEEIEAERRIPHERVWAVLREAGALGLLVPPECGGSGLTISQYVPVIAELAKVHGGLRVLLHVHNSFAHAVAELGTDQQRRELLPGVARGELSIAFALTERDRGTGADIGTTARHEGGEYVLDGRKWLITNSNFASHFLVVVRTGEARGQALSILLVERETPGLTIEPMPPTMGCIGGEHGELTFEGVRASRECLLGGVEGRGEEQLKRALDVSRLLIAASSLGVAEYALALSLARAQERVTFGRPIAERQAIQRYLAEMATDVYALRTMLEDAAAKFDSGERAPAEAAMCKTLRARGGRACHRPRAARLRRHRLHPCHLHRAALPRRAPQLARGRAADRPAPDDRPPAPPSRARRTEVGRPAISAAGSAGLTEVA
jgi:alkylation response protein AidB-like acyl-CoA dehydrogenase